MSTLATADLSDAYPDEISIAAGGFRDYGGLASFYGPIATISCVEDNSKVREAVEEDGHGRVLVVDGAASMRCALLGDILAALAVDNNWSGVIVNGCIRDSAAIGTMQIGVKALATHPQKSVKRGLGERDVPVHFAEADFLPGYWVCADADGILICARDLSADAN